jgi:ribosomal protein L4
MSEAVLAGGFALAGVATQQAIAMLNDRRRFRREALSRSEAEQHDAFVQLVTAGRRVQRALVDRDESRGSLAASERLADELDRLTESAVVVRLIVRDESLLAIVEAFEEHAKRLQGQLTPTDDHLRLTDLIEAIQRFERPALHR